MAVPPHDIVTVTAVPARHGPEGAEPVTGVVTGFVLDADGKWPTLYVSGDNASLDVVDAIARRRVPGIELAVLFVGGARTTLLDGAALTLTSAAAVEAAHLLGSATIVPVHTEGWAHFTEGPDQFVNAFRDAGLSARCSRSSTTGSRPRLVDHEMGFCHVWRCAELAGRPQLPRPTQPVPATVLGARVSGGRGPGRGRPGSIRGQGSRRRREGCLRQAPRPSSRS